MRHLLGALSVLLALPSGGEAQTPAPSETIDRYVKAEVQRQRIPGLSVAVLRGDTIVLSMVTDTRRARPLVAPEVVPNPGPNP
jgi:hypothetical protein